MGRFDINVGGSEWRKWCSQADEPRFTPNFVRRERRARRDMQAAKSGDVS